MQACKAKNVELLDIHKIDWGLLFENTTGNKDVRLFSNTFDHKNKSLLISLYLCGYGSNDDYSIFKAFVADYDVPVNIQDDQGNTVMHHMVQNNDFKATQVLLNALKPMQRINLGIFNNDDESVMCLALKQDMLTLKQKNKDVLGITKENCQMDSLIETLQENEMDIFTASDFHKWCEDEQYDSDAVADDVDDETGSNIFLQLSKENKYFIRVQQIMRMKDDLALIINDDSDTYNQLRCNLINNQTIHHVMVLNMHLVDDPGKYKKLKQRVGKFVKYSKSEQIEPEISAKMKLIHQLLAKYNPEIMMALIHREYEQTVLGYMLNKHLLDDINFYFNDVVHNLLQKNVSLLTKEGKLLYPLFIHTIQSKSIPTLYLNTLHEIIEKCHVPLLRICDANGNNPIHHIISSNMKFKTNILTHLCETYPEWVNMKNNAGNIPLYLSIQHKNINGFYCISKYMEENNMNIKKILKQKTYVTKMIEFGAELLKSRSGPIVIRLLLSTFDYSDIFRWVSKSDSFNNDPDSSDISLIKFVSSTTYKNTIDEILFKKCLLNKKKYGKERISKNKNQKEVKEENKQEEEKKENEPEENKDFKEDEEDEDQDSEDENEAH
eukprot:272302_1